MKIATYLGVTPQAPVPSTPQTEEVTDDTLMPHGKYGQYAMKDVPASYLLWWYDQPMSKFYPEHKAYIDKNRALLEKEVSELTGDWN